jgi:hypothetical protein
MEQNSFFGKEGTNEILEKVFNMVINSYLKKVAKDEPQFNFKIETKKSDFSPFMDNWFILVYTDKPFPSTFQYNDEYQKIKNKKGFHNGMLESEVSNMIKMMGVGEGVNFDVIFMNS